MPIDIQDAIGELINRYQANPANFVKEIGLATTLQQIINSHHGPVIFEGSHADRGSHAPPPNREYAEAILASGTIDRAHCEINGEDIGVEGSSPRLDLVAFEDEIALDIGEWGQRNGSIRFSAADLGAAVEIKFITNKRYMTEGHRSYKGTKSDIEELAKLPKSVAKHSLLFAHYGLLRKPVGERLFKDLQTHHPNVTLHYADPLRVESPTVSSIK